MRFIQVLLCFAVAATASSSAFTAAGVDPASTVIYVNMGAEPGGDGSWNFPYTKLPPALKKARATDGAVTIRIAPGRYVVDSTLVIDRPLILRGSSELIKGPNGLPTGAILPSTETRIVASSGLGTEPLISVGRADGVVISGVTIRNLVLKRADGLATEMTIRRVQDYRVSDNVFSTGGRIGLKSIASSGEVIGNHFSQLETGAIFVAGYPESPSNVLFQGNRSVGNERAGVVLNGASLFIPEHGDQLTAVVRDNDLYGNYFAVHMLMIWREPGLPGDTQETGNIHALLTGNYIRQSFVGVVIDAGYPFRELEGGACDPRNYSGAVDLRVEDNTFFGNLYANLWVTLTHGPFDGEPDFSAAWDYLHAARITISDPQGNFEQVIGTTYGTIYYDSPARDPHVGFCPGDEDHELLGNVLRYNGVRLRGTDYLLPVERRAR